MSQEVESALSLGEKIKVYNDSSLCYDHANRVIDEEGARILKQIKETSSMHDAAKKVGEDYHTVWAKINSMEKACGIRLVERTLGGVGGGYAKLTFTGEFLLQKYNTVKRKLSRLVNSSTILKPDLTIIGSHCLGLEILVKILENKGICVEYMHAGSLTGLEMVYKRFAEIAGIHVFDPNTGEYNTFILNKAKYKGNLAIIKGYVRRQCLITKKENPKGIKSFEDIVKKDITFINRNKASGTRLLIDYLLKQLAKEKGVSFRKLISLIKGYGNEVRSHSEVVTMIKNGKADLGVGLALASKNGLGAVPLRDEEFDFILRKENLGNDMIKDFIEGLKSEEFRKRLSKNWTGISLHKDTGKVIYS